MFFYYYYYCCYYHYYYYFYDDDTDDDDDDAGGGGGEKQLLIMVVGHHVPLLSTTIYTLVLTVHSRITMQPAHPATAVASPESLGGVYTNYSKWVRYGMIFGGLYWWTDGGVLNWIFYGVLFFLGMLYLQQDSLLYARKHPQIPRTPQDIPSQFKMSSPAQYDLRFQDCSIRCPDGVIIQAWLILQPEGEAERAPTMIYFHGNAGNIGMRLPQMSDLCKLCKVNIMAVEYRGYGNSTGEPTEVGLQMDAKASLDYLLLQKKSVIDTEQIYLFGRSLGGAVATWLASESADKLKGLIIENTFASISMLALKLFPLLRLFQFLLPLMLRHKWDTVAAIRKVRMPILFLCGMKDLMIPVEHMKSLYDASENSVSKTFIEFPEGGHNDTPIKCRDKYNEAIQLFLEKCASMKGKQ